MKLEGCNALITGASAGIGREFARQLGGRARSLILIARREESLNELRDELNQQYPNLAVSVRKIDLADLAQLNELLAWLDHERIDVDLLINNAGLGDSGAFATSNPIRNEQMIAREYCRSYRTHSPLASANDRERTWRHFKYQFVSWISSDSRFCGLRRHKSLRDKFL